MLPRDAVQLVAISCAGGDSLTGVEFDRTACADWERERCADAPVLLQIVALLVIDRRPAANKVCSVHRGPDPAAKAADAMSLNRIKRGLRSRRITVEIRVVCVERRRQGRLQCPLADGLRNTQARLEEPAMTR